MLGLFHRHCSECGTAGPCLHKLLLDHSGCASVCPQSLQMFSGVGVMRRNQAFREDQRCVQATHYRLTVLRTLTANCLCSVLNLMSSGLVHVPPSAEWALSWLPGRTTDMKKLCRIGTVAQLGQSLPRMHLTTTQMGCGGAWL